MMNPVSRAAAKAVGSAHYLTGTPCAHGHSAVRWTRNGECTACAEVRRSQPGRRETYNVQARAAYPDRREGLLEKQRQARQQDPERFKKNAAKYCEKHPERRKESARAYYLKNRGKYLEFGRARETGRKQATPAWADPAAIEAVYLQARMLQDRTGVAHHVDHVVPLKGKNRLGEHVVCGLHVHNNLEAVPATLNRAKSNKFEVDLC